MPMTYLLKNYGVNDMTGVSNERKLNIIVRYLSNQKGYTMADLAGINGMLEDAHALPEKDLTKTETIILFSRVRQSILNDLRKKGTIGDNL